MLLDLTQRSGSAHCLRGAIRGTSEAPLKASVISYAKLSGTSVLVLAPIRTKSAVALVLQPESTSLLHCRCRAACQHTDCDAFMTSSEVSFWVVPVPEQIYSKVV